MIKFCSRKMLLFIFCKLFITASLYSQVDDIKFTYYSVEHGLPESAAASIFQDNEGFMWFGTMNGLCRFDGYNFIPLITKNTDVVNTMCVDKSGFMWIGTDNGLIRFNKRTNESRRYTPRLEKKDSLNSGRIMKVIEDKHGNLWIAGEENINIYNREKDSFFKINFSTGKPLPKGKGIRSFIFDRDGNIWFGAEGNGLLFISAKDIKKINSERDAANVKVYSFYKNNSKNLKLGNQEVMALIEDKNKNIWIGTLMDGLIFVKKSDLFKIIGNEKISIKINYIKADYTGKVGLGINKVTSFFEDKLGNLWVGTYGAGLHLYLGNGKFKRYVSNEYIKGSLSNDFIHCIFEDRTGILWVGTSGGGVNKSNANKIIFKAYKKSFSNPEDGLYENMIFSLLEDRDKTLWIGTRNGISRYTPGTKKFFHYSNNPKYIPGVSADMIRSICEDSSGNIWFGTTKYGLIKYDKKTDLFKSFVRSDSSNNTISSNNIRSLMLDNPEELWIGTINGLDIMNLKTGKIFHYYDNKDNVSLSSNYVYSVYKDKWGKIWVCTKSGLSLFDRTTKKFRRFSYRTNKNELDEFSTVAEDDNGVMWLGTVRNGIYKLEPSSRSKSGEPEYSGSSKVEKFSKEPLLNSEFIYCMRRDNLGKIWFGTNIGLWRLNPKTLSVKRFDINDGLQNNEFNSNAAFKAADGTMYFGGVNGFNSFDPKRISEVTTIPKIAITSFKIYDKAVSFNKGFEYIDEIDLSYKDNFFSFEFAALDYADPENNVFAYQLVGFDKDWVYCNNRRFASYTNLEGGDYIFRVKGANKDNVWNEEGISIKIHISPPFYKTIWFQVLSVLMVLFLFISIDRYRTRKLDEQNKKLEIMVKERTEEIKISETRYRTFVSQTSEGIWRCEFEKPILTTLPIDEQIHQFLQYAYVLESNDVLAKMFGFDNSEAIKGKKIKELIPFDHEYNVDFLKKLFSSNYRSVEGKAVFFDFEGNTKYVSNNIVGVIEDSYLMNIWGTMTDITEKLKLEEELIKTQKLESLGIFAGGLAHDFNNLLTGILGNISLAKLYSKAEEKIFKRLNEAEKAVYRAKDLTFQLMTFAKGGAPIKKTLDIKQIIKETADFVLSGSKSKVEYNISNDLWLIDCDEGQMSQVFSNLIINANQAMPEGGVIEVATENIDIMEDKGTLLIRPGKYIRISVKDNGEGIKQDDLTKIFDPFYTTKPKGKGLGLTSVYSIIKRHDGYIDVESEPNHGTEFNIYLPASFSKKLLEESGKDEIKTGSGKVLLMDDDEMILDLAYTLLEEMGYQVETSSEGSEAVRKYKESLQTEKFSAVILDLTVPGGMGGAEAARQILELDTDAKIFISSGYSNDPIMSDYEKYGFAGIIPKPYEAVELNNVLHTVLNGFPKDKK